VKWAPTRSDVGIVDLRAARAALVADASVGGATFGAALSDAVDATLRSSFAAVARDDLVVLALGSYARRELCPGSDVDVLLLHRRPEIAAVADALWYPLWDAGLVLGHAARTAKEALRLAESDLETLTSLLDVRVVAGPATAEADALVHRVRRTARRRRAALIDELAAAATRRRDRPGPIAEVLEPDLKEGSGGLRDLHALGWAGWALGPGGPAALAAIGALHPEDLGDLRRANATLLDVRVALHRVSGRPSDRLVLQDQDGVAALLGADDADDLVRRVAAAGRSIGWIADEAWSALRVPAPRRSRRRGGVGVELSPGVLEHAGTIALAPDASIDGSLVLTVAAIAATRGARVSRDTLQRLRGVAAPTWDQADRDAFITLLRAGRAAIPVIEALDHVGAFTTVLPEWADVRSRPQRNAYHRFTVDRHLLEAVAESASLLDGTAEADRQVVAGLDRPDLLLLAALLHDIAKGQPGDHSEVGAARARVIAERIGLDPAATETLAWLVADHLLLADTATRRDLDDPVTVERFAGRVRDRDRLVLLHALTVADSRATGPAAWGPTKAALVHDLVARAAVAIDAGSVTDPGGFDPFVGHEAEIAAGTLSVSWSEPPEGGLRCTVVAPDRPGLLGAVSAALALAGLDVWSVGAATHASGVALEVFTGVDRFGRLGDDRGRAEATAAIEQACAGDPDLAARLAARAEAYRRGAPVRGPVTVQVDVLGSATATVVEVFADDEVGRFAHLAMLLAEAGVDVTAARATTIGDRIVDTFYVRDVHGKIVDPLAIARIRRSIIEGLEGGAPGAADPRT